jgi:uncharacterized protein (DUF1697 family)
MSVPQTSVAFLRGINLGRRRVTSPQLVEVFLGLGFEQASTFLASGNVLFAHHGPADPDGIAAGLAEALGYPVPTTVRSADELRELARMQPFAAEAIAASTGKRQVMLLFEAPSAPAQAEVLALATPNDQLRFGQRALHWLPSGGVAESRLDLDRVTKLLGLNTVRTANTISRLVAKL